MRETGSHVAQKLPSIQIVRLIAIMICAATIAGCRPKIAPPRTTKFYNGPTQDMAYVVAAVNRNNSRIPTIWARHRYAASVIDERRRVHEADGDGSLQYRAPGDLMFIGDTIIAPRVFEIGSNSERYWMKLRAPKNPSQMWWGNYANLGKPCVKPIPVQPDLLMEVLGVDVIPTDFFSEPAPVMRFSNENDAYIIVWSYRTRSGWVAQKEVWYDRLHIRPVKVLLYDPRGRVQIQADLAAHRPITGDFIGEAPTIATQYTLFFPDSETKMHIELQDVRLQRDGRPNDRSFRFPGTGDVSEMIQIDEDCGS